MASDHKSSFVEGHISRLATEPRQAKQDAYLFRGLEIACDSSQPRVFIIIPENMSDFGREDLYTFPLLCWEGARIAAHDLHFSNELDDGSFIYNVTPETDLILEPYRPVSVTETVEAVMCLHSAELRLRVPPEEYFWMAKGRMVHTLFGYLIRGITDGIKPDFTKAYANARLAIMEILPGSRISTNETDLETEAYIHFQNLYHWLDRSDYLSDTICIEEDKISSRYGLKGRADAVVRGADEKTILELKTGRIPVEDHMLQLYAYSLLFSDQDDTPRVTGQLFYSLSGRSRSLESGDRHALLHGRNNLIAMKFRLAYGNDNQGTMPQDFECLRNGKCFSRSSCREYFGDTANGHDPVLSGIEKEYYDRWFRLLSLEAWEVDSSLARILDPQMLDDRLENGETHRIVSLVMKPHEGATKPDAKLSPFEVHLEIQLDSSSSNLNLGELVIVHQGDPCAGTALRGQVIRSDHIGLSIRVSTPLCKSSGEKNCRTPIASFQNSRPWYLDTLPFSRGLEAASHGLWRFLHTGDPGVVDQIVGSTARQSRVRRNPDENSYWWTDDKDGEYIEPEMEKPDSIPDDLCYSEGLHAELNEDQEAAVRAAISSEKFHLVHGPPGTGKTRVLARIIRACLDEGERLLVACPTNIALDRLLLAVIKLGPLQMLRIGRLSSITRELLEELHRTGHTDALLAHLTSGKSSFKQLVQRVKETKLVAATAYQAISHPLFVRQRFDRVIIDEAGQLDEPTSLGPLALAPKFVLGGDHLQLPPVVQSTSSIPANGQSLTISLFERLFNTCERGNITRLKTQYRMNNHIQSLPSKLFYNGTLVASSEAATRRLNVHAKLSNSEDLSRIIDPRSPVVFVDVPGVDKGRARPEEADAVSEIVKGLVTVGVPVSEIGIITPYRAQQALIKQRLGVLSSAVSTVSVDTVDRFQGGEREVILLSLTRSDGVTSFLADQKRLNVSLSRARSKLILLGNGAVLQEHPLFAALLDGLDRIIIKNSE